MNNAALIMSQSALSPRLVESPANRGFRSVIAKGSLKKTDKVAEARQQQIAKDFESILLDKLLEQMKNTIGQWGFEEDSSSRAVQELFWPYLARDIANTGGMGLWKDIYRFMINADRPDSATLSVDTNG